MRMKKVGVSMEKISKIVPVAEQIEIIPLGDLHLGSQNCRVDKIKDMIKYISQQKDCYVILMGDIFDCILGNDKRLDLSERGRAFLDILDDATTLLTPIKEKIVCGLIGNHEYKLRKDGIGDPIFHLAERLGFKWAGFSCFVKFRAIPKTHRESLVIYCHHGWFAGRMRGSKVNNIERLAQHYEADVYIVGHSHDIFSTRSVKISWGGDKNILFVNSGSFLETAPKGTVSYSERAGYPPQKLGVVKLKWYPKQGKIYATE